MTQVKVILTKSTVYVTFGKTIHYAEKYKESNTYLLDKQKDDTTVHARSLAFSLASTSFHPLCEIVDFTDRADFTRDQIFQFLNKTHQAQQL